MRPIEIVRLPPIVFTVGSRPMRFSRNPIRRLRLRSEIIFAKYFQIAFCDSLSELKVDNSNKRIN